MERGISQQRLKLRLRRLSVGQHHSIEPVRADERLRRSDVRQHRHPGAAAAGPLRVDNANRLDACFAGAEDRNLGEVAGAIKCDVAPAAGGAAFEQIGAIPSRPPEKVEGNREVFRRQPALFAKALRRQVLGVAIERDLAHFDQALAHTAAQIGVGETQGDAEIAGELALGDAAVALDRGQQTEHDLGIGCVAPRLGQNGVSLCSPVGGYTLFMT